MSYIEEEFLMESFVVLAWIVVLIIPAITEFLDKIKPKKVDELSQRKLRKITPFIYRNCYIENPITAKEETAKTLKEIYNKNLTNQKYDLLKRRLG